MSKSDYMPAAPARPARLSGRSTVFLDEMGIGPLWGLRHGLSAEALDAPAAAATQAGTAASGATSAAMPRAAVPASASAGTPAAMPAAAELALAAPAPIAAVDLAAAAGLPARPSAADATAALAPPSAAESTTSPAPATPVAWAAPVSVDDSVAAAPDAFADAPAAAGAARGAASQAAPAPAVAQDDDGSTAWFDDAPASGPAAPVSAEAIAAMDWNELRAAAAKCTRCELCRGRKSAVFGRGDADAEWLVLGGAPLRADEKNVQAISGEAGQLLDNMLQAVGVSTAKRAYVTNLVKCRAIDGAGLDRAPTPDEAAACQPFLQRELALTRASTVLAFGQATLKGLLGNAAPAKRGTVHRLGQLNVVASFHPEDLLRQGENKAKAWADLCLAKGAHVGRG